MGDDKIEIAQCGPSGEKLSRLAAVINMANRAAGRTGMGAVMGSKNLKAVVARGKSKRLPVADAKRINELAKPARPRSTGNPGVAGLKDMAPPRCCRSRKRRARLPTRNYNEGQFEDFEAISGE